MRIVISYESFAEFAGTETYILAIARQLDGLGHDVVIYAQSLGAMAEFARGEGVQVADDAAELPATCDAVLAQDAAGALELRERYPGAVCVHVAHSRGFALQMPTQLEGVCQAVVVLNDRVRRFVEHMSFHAPIVRLCQPVELKRFGPLGLDPQQPRRALVLGNYLRGAQAELLENACREAGMEIVTVGAHGRVMARTEHAIADADVVFGLGRCVLEAMAGRRAAYVYGVAGADGWVTPTSYAALEQDGFSGQVSGTPLDLETLTADLRAWHPAMGADNRALACAHHGVSDHVTELLTLIRKLGAPVGEPLSHTQELTRLVRLEWQAQGLLRGVIEENRQLRERLEEAQQEGARARDAANASEERHAEVDRRLESLRTTRRYRLACRIASPLDAARRAVRSFAPGSARRRSASASRSADQ